LPNRVSLIDRIRIFNHITISIKGNYFLDDSMIYRVVSPRRRSHSRAQTSSFGRGIAHGTRDPWKRTGDLY